MISYLLHGLFILSCLALVISVLLQPGKADAGQLFTSSVSSTAFGPRGTQTILAKITIGAAITFMVVALLLTMGVGGERSLMEGGVAKPAATPAPAASPAQPNASPAEGSAAPAPQTESSPAQGTAAPAPATTPAPAAPEQK
ncbi:MAG TPA: preprotein translocase subunit SecG [Pyrinomonadaceae bacterium]|nr:preprotein translocase subunit SecG [Pyrinomonadaceae bacterium]